MPYCSKDTERDHNVDNHPIFTKAYWGFGFELAPINSTSRVEGGLCVGFIWACAVRLVFIARFRVRLPD